jgi:putative membrane protein
MGTLNLFAARTLYQVRQGRLLSAWLISLLVWIALLIATPISIWLAGDGVFPLLAAWGVLAQATAAFLGLAGGWPARQVLVAFALVSTGAWAVEALGSATGFPFGAYGYTSELQPQLAGVPLLIPLAWFMMLVPAWAVAETILARRRERLAKWYAPVHAVLAGAAFTAWDLYLDPQMVARGLWVWDQPGGYFGIPWVNFLGWWLAAALLTLLIRPRHVAHPRLLVIYTLTWGFQAVGLGLFWGLPGPALTGFLAMGAFATWSWRKQLPHRPTNQSFPEGDLWAILPTIQSSTHPPIHPSTLPPTASKP